MNAFKWFTSFPGYVFARFGTERKKKISKLWLKDRRIETKKKKMGPYGPNSVEKFHSLIDSGMLSDPLTVTYI